MGIRIRDRAIHLSYESFYSYISSPRNHKDHFLLRGTPRRANLRLTCRVYHASVLAIDETKTVNNKKIDNLDIWNQNQNSSNGSTTPRWVGLQLHVHFDTLHF